jgi:hypothetical protein
VRRVLLVAALMAVAARTEAQRFQVEVRADGYDPPGAGYRVAPAAGLNTRVGRYVRAGYSVNYRSELRHMLLARFTFDPYRETRWGFSAGGGVTYDSQAWLTVLADLEGPRTKGMLPFVQLALGGGPRFSLGVRQARRSGR